MKPLCLPASPVPVAGVAAGPPLAAGSAAALSTTAVNPVSRASSAITRSGDVRAGSKVTVGCPASYETLASSTPSTLSRATRAVVAHVIHVMPLTARVTVRPVAIASVPIVRLSVCPDIAV